jgi:Protein of unknown function (DUF995)
MAPFPWRAAGAAALLAIMAGCTQEASNVPPAAAPAPTVPAAPTMTMQLPVTGPAIATPPVAAAPVYPATGSVTAPPAAAGVVAVPASGGPMAVNDILATLTNNTVSGVAGNGQSYYAWYGQGGRLRFRQGSNVDSGTWIVTADGRLCSVLSHAAGGNEACYKLYRDSGGAYRFATADGTAIGTFTVLAGNPQNL